MDEISHSIGKAIAELRREKGWTQAELAEKLNVSDKAISKWEKGGGLPGVEFFPTLAELFGVSIDYIMTGSDRSGSEPSLPHEEVCKEDLEGVGEMKKCEKCGAVCNDGAAFCQGCGAKLDAGKAHCKNCGAAVADGAAFCSRCGAKLSEPEKTKCEGCGAELDGAGAFCRVCGKPTGKQTKEKPVRGVKSSGGFINKAKAFDGATHYLTNIFIMCISLALVLVALLCPIRVYELDATGVFANEKDISTVESNQSIYKILGALGYVALDSSDPSDYAKIKDQLDDFTRVVDNAQNNYTIWLSLNSNATNEEKQQKLNELVADAIVDINYYAYLFSYTTVGAYDKYYETDIEASMDSILVAQRDNAIVGLSVAAVAAVFHLIIAVMAFVFFILAAVGIGLKRRFASVSLLPFIASIISGAGLMFLMVAPQLSAGGGMFVISLFSVLTYFAIEAASAALSGKSLALAARHICFSIFAVVGVYLMTAHTLKMSLRLSSLGNSGALEYENGGTVHGPLGNAFFGLIMFGDLSSITNGSTTYNMLFSPSGVVGAIISLVLGAGAFAAMYTALMCSLHKLMHDPESNRRAGAVPMAVGAAMLIMFAIVPAAIGAASEAPVVTDNTTGGVLMMFSVKLPVFFAIGFASAAVSFLFLFDRVKRPNAAAAEISAAKQPVEAQPAEQSTEAPPLDSEKS